MRKNYLITGIVLSLCLLFAAAAMAAPKFTAAEGKVLNETQKLIEAQNYGEAYNKISAYINANKPEKAEFYQLLGTVHYFRKEFSKAYDAYLRSFKLDGKNADVAQNLGSVAYELGRYGDAGKYLEEAYKLAKNKTTDMCYNAASAYYLGKQYKNAARMCQILINNRSVFQKTAYVELAAISLAESQQYDAAKKLMQEALRQNPNNMRFWQILANVSLSQNDYVTLAMALEVSYALEPPQANKWVELGNVYIYINAPARALLCYQKGYGNTSDINNLRRMSQTAFQAGLFERGIEYLDKAIAVAQDEELSRLHADKGYYLYDRGKWARAIDEFRKCLQTDVSGAHSDVLLFIGYAQVELNQIEAAKATFKSGLAGKNGNYHQSMLEMLNEMYPDPGAPEESYENIASEAIPLS